jgi:phosphonate transport system substrate-binding protein
MPFIFTVSPDFTPDHLSGWYIFNTWLQKQTDLPIHLEMYNDFSKQREAISDNKIDLIYANPFDAAMLVREKGFLPLVKPLGTSDEAIIAINHKNPINSVEDLFPGIRVAYTNDPDVQMIGMILLEPGNIEANNIKRVLCDTYVQVAKNIIQDKTDVGIFLAEAYDNLSNMIKKEMKVLVRSQISVIHHSLLIGPELIAKRSELQSILTNMNQESKAKSVLESLGFTAWQKIEDEEMEFMIDLMDTLVI